MLAFTMYTMPAFSAQWYHVRICKALDQFARGDLRRLMVFMPPQMGKSELVSRRFPAFALGRNVNDKIIAASYGADLAGRMNRDVQRIIDNDKYARVFPATRISGKNIRTLADGTWMRNSDMFEVVGHSGSYRSAGIGGGITGMGGTIGIIDDPIKDQKQADSPTVRQSIWDWYISTFLTRLGPNPRIAMLLTRWHEDDLAGRILAQPDHGFTVIKFPMMKDEQDKNDPRDIGETLWPTKYSKESVAEIKTRSGSRVWNALYQQRPSALEGGIFQRKWFKFYRELPDHFDEIIDSWDFTFKDTDGSDYVVGTRWARLKGRFFLLQRIRDRMDFPTSIKAIRSLSLLPPKPSYILVEDTANGPAVIATIKGEITGVIAVKPERSKEARAHAVSPLFEAGNVEFPDPSIAPWISDYMEELVNFPTWKHDDQVDSTTQALQRLSDPGRGSFTKRHSETRIRSIVGTMGGDQW